NTSPEGAADAAETMFKRCWWRGFKGRFAAVRWNTHWTEGFDNVPGIGQPLSAYLARYDRSEHNAWYSGEALKRVVNSLPAGYDKNLVAHSMGNVVGGSALRAGLTVNNYALLQGAIPAGCYDERADLQQPPAKRYYFPLGNIDLWNKRSPDQDDDVVTRSLSYRGQLRNVNTNVVNFYLEPDRATSYCWELNNTLKPDNGFG